MVMKSLTMWRRRKIEGLIAASVYEELSEEEARLLEAHLTAHPECRADAAALAKLAGAIPAVQPQLDHDLLPALRRRLAEPPVRVFAFQPVWTAAYAAAAVVLVAMGYGLWAGRPATESPGGSVVVGVPSPVAIVLAEAARLKEMRDYAGAYLALDRAVNEYPSDACAGEAQRQLADIAFSELHWYEQADAAYRKLQTQYRAVFEGDMEAIRRRNILDEARAVNYASLQRLDAARCERTDALAKLEDVIRDHAGTYVASLASQDMARIVMEREFPEGGAESYLHAMEKARDRCRSGVAVAQLNLEIGHLHRDRFGDLEQARLHYEQAAQSPMLAQRATEALMSLAALAQ